MSTGRVDDRPSSSRHRRGHRSTTRTAGPKCDEALKQSLPHAIPAGLSLLCSHRPSCAPPCGKAICLPASPSAGVLVDPFRTGRATSSRTFFVASGAAAGRRVPSSNQRCDVSRPQCSEAGTLTQRSAINPQAPSRSPATIAVTTARSFATFHPFQAVEVSRAD